MLIDLRAYVIEKHIVLFKFYNNTGRGPETENYERMIIYYDTEG